MSQTTKHARPRRLDYAFNTFACWALGIFLAFAATQVHAVPGQPGTLDATWGANSAIPGTTITFIGNANDAVNALALQPDGKVIVGGRCFDTNRNAMCAFRYLPNGTPDASFGSNGAFATTVGVSSDVTAIAVQPDGRIVLGGLCFNGSDVDFCALRLLPDSTPDTSFGNAGKVITPFGNSNDVAMSMALQPDGKMVLVGRCADGNRDVFCAIRYLSNGTLDPAFGTNGKVATTMNGVNDRAHMVTLQPDGKIVLAGFCFGATNEDFCALRYLPNGALDPSFGSGGKVIATVGGGDDFAYAVTRQPDAKLVLAGRCANGTAVNFCAIRLFENGVLDPSFGLNGRAITAINGTTDIAHTVTMQGDGRIVLSGACVTSNSFDFCALRYLPNGLPDPSFGNGGKVTVSLRTAFDGSFAAAIQPDGKIVLAGTCLVDGRGEDFCTVRLDGGPFGYRACSLDLDGDGRVLPTTDGLIMTRVLSGTTTAAAINGITFASNASRNSWPAIREYLIAQCGVAIP